MTPKLNVLMVSPFSSRLVGGVGTVTETLFKAMNKQGRARVTLASHFPFLQNGHVVNREVGVYHPIPVYPSQALKSTYATLEEFLEGTDPGAFDVIHFQNVHFGNSYAGLDQILKWKRKDAPVVTTTHFVIVDPAEQKNFNDPRFRMYEASDAHICFSVFGRESVIGGREDLRQRSILLPNGIEPPQETPVSKADARLQNPSHGVGVDDIVLLYVGRIAEEKGLLRIAQAFPAIHQYARHALGRRANLVIVGGGDRRIRQQMESYLAPVAYDVSFAGHLLEPQKIGRYYRMADILLAPSDYESFSLSAVDAMIRGVPVVITANTAPKELFVDRHLAIGVDPDTRSLINTTIHCLDQLGSPELSDMCRRAYDVGRQEYDIAGVADRTVDIYANLIGGSDDQLYQNALRKMRRGENEEALALFGKLKKDTTNERERIGVFMYGLWKAINREHDAALQLFTRVVSEDQDHLAAHYQIGKMHYQYGEYPQAKIALVYAKELDENHPQTLYLLGQTVRQMNTTNDFGAEEFAKWLIYQARELDPAVEANL